MLNEMKSPSPSPDWQVLNAARRAAQHIAWLVEQGKITEEEAEGILNTLGTIIEDEATLLT